MTWPVVITQTICFTMMVSSLTELTMAQEIKYPKGTDLDSPLGPPLINVDVAAEKYHASLFEGPYGLPSVDEIQEILAELNETPGYGDRLESYPVPREFYSPIMDFFKGSIIQPTPNFILPENGTLLIRTKDGRSRRICWYGGQMSPLNFSLHGVRCIAPLRGPRPGDEAWALNRLLRDAHAKAKIK